MKVSFSFRHMTPSQEVLEYAGRKLLGSVTRLVDGLTRANLVFSPSRHLVHVHGTVYGSHGLFVEASEEATSPQAAVDGLVQKLETLIRKRKELALSARHVISHVSPPLPEVSFQQTEPATSL